MTDRDEISTGNRLSSFAFVALLDYAFAMLKYFQPAFSRAHGLDLPHKMSKLIHNN
jgi:hypothetical protein